ncbi:MAG: Crp/Fnr family transcriptional regulator [Humidesulfovibrio sp.]|nr:Crp/Fnr family transcriptional regulator [Humidesulfovibrio sp.]
MPAAKVLPESNLLLNNLPHKSRARVLEHCEPAALVFGEILCEPGRPIRHVYFPLTGFISLVATLGDHPPLEMGLIGNEGMLGATLALGVKTVPLRAVVQGAGTALRMSAAHCREELQGSPGLLRALHRYLYVQMAQLSQTAACTHFHEIEPRLACWLLMTHDRAHADHFHLTHAFLADMLGVRRSGVTIAAGALQLRGLIRYSRGEIIVLDRKGLEAASCECYAALAQVSSTVLP